MSVNQHIRIYFCELSFQILLLVGLKKHLNKIHKAASVIMRYHLSNLSVRTAVTYWPRQNVCWIRMNNVLCCLWSRFSSVYIVTVQVTRANGFRFASNLHGNYCVVVYLMYNYTICGYKAMKFLLLFCNTCNNLKVNCWIFTFLFFQRL